MRLKLFVLSFGIIFRYVSHAQNIILLESVPGSKYEYLNQLEYIETSLINGSMDTRLRLSDKIILTDSLVRKLSDRFKKTLPGNFFMPKGSAIGISERDHGDRILSMQRTYAQIKPDRSVVSFIRLIVYFDEDLKGNNPKILNVELKTKNLISTLSHEEIIQKYEWIKPIRENLPKPPPVKH